MAYLAMDKTLEKNRNIYKFVLVASKRALELSEGAQPLVPKGENPKITTTALREIMQGKVFMKGTKPEIQKAEKPAKAKEMAKEKVKTKAPEKAKAKAKAKKKSKAKKGKK